MRIQSGLSYELYQLDNHLINGVVDAAYQIVPNYNGLIAGVGVEYGYKEMIFVRTGYHYEDELVGSSYGTLGLGGSFSGFSLDLAYILASSTNPMNQTILMSLRWKM
jgi:hypothetical protein